MAELRRIRFFGPVQGIGFRWTTARIARQHGIAGWVRNCADGTVELEAEAEPTALDAFLEEIRAAFSGCIAREACAVDSLAGHASFEIRH